MFSSEVIKCLAGGLSMVEVQLGTLWKYSTINIKEYQRANRNVWVALWCVILVFNLCITFIL